MRLFLSLCLFCLITTVNSSCDKHPSVGGAIKKTCIRNQCFAVELAQTEDEFIIGLQNRLALELEKGMLFIFPKEEGHNFWMKETLIPLDIIWIDEHLKVVHIKYNAQPCFISGCPVFSAPQASRYVLEINGELAQKYHFMVGDVARFQYN